MKTFAPVAGGPHSQSKAADAGSIPAWRINFNAAAAGKQTASHGQKAIGVIGGKSVQHANLNRGGRAAAVASQTGNGSPAGVATGPLHLFNAAARGTLAKRAHDPRTRVDTAKVVAAAPHPGGSVKSQNEHSDLTGLDWGRSFSGEFSALLVHAFYLACNPYVNASYAS